MKKLLILLSISTLTASLSAPLLANTTPERIKRETNPNQCDESCELKFSKIGKSAWVISNYLQGSYHLEIDTTNLKLSNDFAIQVGNGDFVQRPALQLFVDKDSVVYNQINNFYRSNGSYKSVPFKEFYFVDNLINFKLFLNKKITQGFNTKMFHITSFSAEMAPFPSLEWVKQQSQFNLVDSTKTMIWTRPDLITVDDELNIAIANPNIDKVIFDNVLQPQTNKQWKINVKPEIAPRDHHLQVFFTSDGKPYTSEITVSMQAKIDAPAPGVKQNLRALVKKTELGNLFDNNHETIMVAINQKNANAIDDTSQLEITNKESNQATLTAKPDSTSYAGSVEVTYNVIPATIVDLKIDLKPTSNQAIAVQDYVGQIDPSAITNPVQTFYFVNSESTIIIKKPTISSVITGVVYACDAQWNKTSQASNIDETKGIVLDGSQLNTKNGKYVVELSDNLGHTNNLYLQIAPKQAITNYFDTSNGKQFEQWALVNGHDNIRGVSARQLNKLFAASQTWPPQANGSENANSFEPKTANNNLPNNNKSGLTGWTVVGIIVGALSGLLLLGWLVKKFVVTPLILEPIRKKKAKAFAEQTAKDIAQMKADEAEEEKRKREK